MDEDSIKRNIQKVREDLCLTQEEFAQKLNIARNTYRNIEKGPTRIVCETIYDIAKFTGIKLEQLLLGYEPVEDYSAVLKDTRASLNQKIEDLTSFYSQQIADLHSQIEAQNNLVKSQEKTINSLNSIIQMMLNK